MAGFLLLVTILAVCSCAVSEPLLTEEFIQELKSSVNWTVIDYIERPFRDLTLEQARDSLHNLDPEDTSLPEPISSIEPAPTSQYPAEFDARKAWPKCVHKVRNQGCCSAAWALASTSALSDRFCIQGQEHMLAPQDPISCSRAHRGCKAGDLRKALLYLQNTGTVEETCFPFVSGNVGDVPKCPSQCPTQGNPWKKYRCGPARKLETVDLIKNDLVARGPVVASFTLYKDLYAYRRGVYYHKSGDKVGDFSVKVVGWGTEEGVDYWLCQNIWGPSWGVSGYFMIKQGDCWINKNFFACDPVISS